MKKIILAAVMMIVVLSSGKSFGQLTRTATVNLNITLSDVLEMTVNQDGAMTMDFDNTTKYSNGIQFTAVNQIVVRSSKAYVVTAVEGTITGTSALPSGSVKILPTIATANNGNTTGLVPAASEQTLLPGGITVITAANSSWNGANASNTFDVAYSVGANGVFANKVAASNNVIPVVYTVTQP